MGGQSSKKAASGGEEEKDGEGRKRRRAEEDEDPPHTSPATAKKGRQRHHKKKARPAAAQRTFKVCLTPGDVRRFTIPLGLWSEFEALLRSQYPWAFDHAEGWVVAIRYEDESGDLCILSSQLEWDALCHNPLLGRIVRVFINHEMPKVTDGLHTIKAEKMEEADDTTTAERDQELCKHEDELESSHYGTRVEENESVYSGDQQERLLLPREEFDGLTDYSVDLCDLAPSAPVALDVEEAWPTEDSVYGSMMTLEAYLSGCTTTTTTTATASVVESEENEPEQDDREQHDGAYDEDGNYYERLRRQREEAEGWTQASESAEATAPTVVVEQVGGDDGDLNEGGQEDHITTDEPEQTYFPSSPLQVDASAFPAARKKNGRRRLRRSSSSSQ